MSSQETESCDNRRWYAVQTRSNMEQKELALREQRLDSELQLANELNVSMLPKALPQRDELSSQRADTLPAACEEVMELAPVTDPWALLYLMALSHRL